MTFCNMKYYVYRADRDYNIAYEHLHRKLIHDKSGSAALYIRKSVLWPKFSIINLFAHSGDVLPHVSDSAIKLLGDDIFEGNYRYYSWDYYNPGCNYHNHNNFNKIIHYMDIVLLNEDLLCKTHDDLKIHLFMMLDVLL